MNLLVSAVLSVALVICVVALVRETRMRRALQRLLKLIFEKWRSHDQVNESRGPDSVRGDDGGM